MDQIKLTGELAEETATLTLSLDGLNGAAIYGKFRLDVPGSGAKIILPVALLGYDLARFAEEAERLSATLKGTAELRASSETFLRGMSIMEDRNAVRAVRPHVRCEIDPLAGFVARVTIGQVDRPCGWSRRAAVERPCRHPLPSS